MSQNRLFKIIIACVVLVVLVFAGVYVFIRNNINTVEINGTRIYYSAAITDEEKSIGLSQTPELGSNEGMLFFFNKESPAFWMKDMSYPIDIIWISGNKVLKIDTGVSPQPEGEALRSYFPPAPVDYVLEVNAGFSEEHNIKVGDVVRVN